MRLLNEGEYLNDNDSIPKYFKRVTCFNHQKHLNENAKTTYTHPILTTVPC